MDKKSLSEWDICRKYVAKVDQLMLLCGQLKTQLSQARQLNQQLARTLVEQAVA